MCMHVYVCVYVHVSLSNHMYAHVWVCAQYPANFCTDFPCDCISLRPHHGAVLRVLLPIILQHLLLDFLAISILVG